MGNVQQAVPLFGVTNLKRSIDFYVEGLEFEMINHWMDNGKMKWCHLQKDQAGIMLQEFSVNHLQQIKNQVKGYGIDIYFICEDALEIYKMTRSKNLLAKEPFVGNQMWVVSMKDPDGYHNIFESDTDVDEETTYSEWLGS